MTTTVPETYPSFRALSRLILQSALPRPQKAVLQALLAYARPDLTVYHAQGQLAWECDYTRPTIKQALRALKAQAILRVLGTPRQHSATEYAIDLSRLPRRAPYHTKTTPDEVVSGGEAICPLQEANDFPPAALLPADQRITDVPADVLTPLTQGETGLPPDKPEGQWLSLSGQMISPQVVQDEQEKNLFLHGERRASGVHAVRGEHSPPALTPRYSRPAAKWPLETSAPAALPVTEALRRWAAEAVPGLPLDRERDKFLCYARAHGVTNVEWSEALKGWWLEAYDRAARRGDLQPLAVPTPARAPDPPPVYDPALHAQMKADIAQLERRFHAYDQAPRRRRERSLQIPEEVLGNDPVYRAILERRRQALLAQTARVQTQGVCLEAAGAAD
jgi:hypothetical protein